MKQRSISIVFIAVILISVMQPISIGLANEDYFQNNNELREAVQNFLSADVADVQWAKTAEDTVIAVYHTGNGFGIAVMEYNPSTGFTIVEKNERIIPWKEGGVSIRLDDHTPEYSIDIRWDDHLENDYLTLERDDSGVWRIAGLEYSRKESDLEDTMVFCHLSEDGKTAVISPLVDPRIEWSVDQEFTLANFNLADAQNLCEKALAILRSSDRENDTGEGYRIVHAALDRYEPKIPIQFDSRMNDEENLLILSQANQDGRVRTEWIFHWEEDKEVWILIKAIQTELNEPAIDETYTITESVTEITAEAIDSTQQIRNKESREILYISRDVKFPNVLGPEVFYLNRFNFDTPPVNANGYNWSRNYGGYADPTLMPKLFGFFFPDDTYADGYLQEDKTLTFIARKTDGALVLLCGADEGEAGWEWVESTPLPEGTRIGDENITDAVNLGVWRGRAAVGVRRMERGRWGVYYVNSYDFFAGPDWIGMYGPETDAQFFGNHAWSDITTIDWSSLPPEEYIGSETKKEKDARISAFVDRTNWAAPSHSDPYVKTNLLKEAGDESSLIGSFYDGTPLFVLERGTEWTNVRIGHGENTGVINGWMHTKDLAFGNDTLHIDRKAIRIQSEKVLIHPVEPYIGSRAGMITAGQYSGCLVIGEAMTDQNYAIVYNLRDGDVGLIPEKSFGNGNG